MATVDSSQMEEDVSDDRIEFLLNDLIATHEEHPFRKVFQHNEFQFIGQISKADVTDFVDSLEALQNCRYIFRDKSERPGAKKSGRQKPREAFTFRDGGEFEKVCIVLLFPAADSRDIL